MEYKEFRDREQLLKCIDLNKKESEKYWKYVKELEQELKDKYIINDLKKKIGKCYIYEKNECDFKFYCYSKVIDVIDVDNIKIFSFQKDGFNHIKIEIDYLNDCFFEYQKEISNKKFESEFKKIKKELKGVL